MPKFIDEVGNKYGKLLVISRAHSQRSPRFNCLCDCGKTVVRNSKSLREGLAKSCGCGRSLPFGESSCRALYRFMATNAKYRGLVFELDMEYFRWITKQNCTYCGSEPYQIYHPKRHNGEYIYNGIDRVDNTVGYIIENTVPCCGYCNFMKSATTELDFREWVCKVYNHWASR